MYTDIKKIQIKKLTLEIDKLLKQEEEQKELNQIKGILHESCSQRNLNIQKLYSKYEKIMNSKNFSDLGISFEEAVNILKAEGYPLILEPADNIENPQSEYTRLEDFVLVHRTDRMPKNNRLESVAGEKKGKINYPLNGKMYEFPCEGEKNSIQYVMNNEIQVGSWSDCKYTIIIPFTEVPKELVGGVSPGNAYTLSGIDLTKKCYIICKKGEAEELRRQNPKLALNNIMEYEGDSIKGASNILIKLLGYRVEEPNNAMDYDSWKNKDAEDKMKDTMEKHGFKCQGYTEASLEEENAIRGINSKIALYLGIKNNNLVRKFEDVNGIFEQLKLFKYDDEELKYMDIMWKKLEEKDIVIQPKKRKWIQNVINMKEEDLQKLLDTENDSLDDEEKEILNILKDSFKSHTIKKEKLGNYSVMAHVKSDLINKFVLEGIALSKEKENLR